MTAWESLKDAPRRIGEAAQQRPQLRGLSRPPRRVSTIPFAVMMVGLFIAGMVGLLLLNTQLQNQAFEVRAVQREANERGYRVSDLESQLTRAKAPAELGRRATELGMVPNPHSVFIDLASGKVVGTPTPARGDEIPSLKVLPPAPAVPPLDPNAPAVDPNNPDAGTAAAPSAAQPGASPAGGAAPAPAEPSVAQPSAAQPSAAQPSAAQPSAAQPSTTPGARP